MSSPREANRIGLAGPAWGLGAGLLAFVLGRATGQAWILAIAQLTAVLNLFNLIPIPGLDGSHGVLSLVRWQRFALAAVAAGAAVLVPNLVTFVLPIGLAIVAFRRPVADEPDHAGLVNFAGLIVALAALMAMPVPGVDAAPFALRR